MNPLSLFHLIILANTVNCSLYWFFKPPTPTTTTTTTTINEMIVDDTEIAPVVPNEPVKVEVILSETEDEEKKQLFEELAEQKRRSLELAAARRARYLASLPQKFDSMEMIEAEAALSSRLDYLVKEQKKRIANLWDHLKNMKYGHSQYSDEESQESNVEEPANSSSSSSTESDENDNYAYIRYITGEPAEKVLEPTDSVENFDPVIEDIDDTFEVIEDPNEVALNDACISE